MSQVINISGKLSLEKSKIVLDDKEYVVNDGLDSVMKFEELIQEQTGASMLKAIEIAIGEEAVKELNIKKLSLPNFKVIVIAITAAIQDIDYEKAAERFQRK